MTADAARSGAARAVLGAGRWLCHAVLGVGRLAGLPVRARALKPKRSEVSGLLLFRIARARQQAIRVPPQWVAVVDRAMGTRSSTRPTPLIHAMWTTCA